MEEVHDPITDTYFYRRAETPEVVLFDSRGKAVHEFEPGPVQQAEQLPLPTFEDALNAFVASERKKHPIATGVVDYFPDALSEVALVSYTGNNQHHPGAPLHWDRSKSTDESDALIRHFVERGTRDTDGMRHSAKVAWRALAMLQKEIEADE